MSAHGRGLRLGGLGAVSLGYRNRQHRVLVERARQLIAAADSRGPRRPGRIHRAAVALAKDVIDIVSRSDQATVVAAVLLLPLAIKEAKRRLRKPE